MPGPWPRLPTIPRSTSSASGLHRVLARPRVLAIACLAILAAAGLGLSRPVARRAQAGAGREPVRGCCAARPSQHPSAIRHGAMDIALVYLMWAAMTFAMMLPTAGPMVLTYAEIAETAAAKREPVVSPLVLTAGYLAVWLGFAAVATLLQWVPDTRSRCIDPALGGRERPVLRRRVHRRRRFISSPPSSTPASRCASGRFRSSSPTGARRRAPCSASACARASIASAAVGR